MFRFPTLLAALLIFSHGQLAIFSYQFKESETIIYEEECSKVYYGNECNAAYRAFNLSNTPSFNENDYFSESYACFKNHRFKFNHNQVSDCLINLHNWYMGHMQSQMGIWSATPDAAHYAGQRLKAEMDCTYEVQSVTFNRILSEKRLEYNFLIQQSNCNSKLPIQGGTSFDVFGINDLFMTTCNYIDGFDNVYEVTCSLVYGNLETLSPNTFQQYINKDGSGITSNASPTNCLYVTIMVMYEHYDAYHEFSRRFHPLRKPIVDNRQYCLDIQEVKDSPSLKLSASASKVSKTLKKGVSWYDAIWLRNVSHPKLLYELEGTSGTFTNLNHTEAQIDGVSVELNEKNKQYFGNSTYWSGFDYHAAAGRLTSVHARDVPIQYAAKVSPDQLANTYTSHVFVTHNDNQDQENRVQYVSASDFNDKLSYFNRAGDDWHNFYFIGASHMRYYFDTVARYTFNDSVLNRYVRKHFDADIENIHFRDRSFMEQMMHTIMESCYVDEIQKTIVIQFGGWDLYRPSLRRTLRDLEHGAQVLIDGLRDLFSGKVWCNGLRHLVWVTSHPHPLCNTEEETNKQPGECEFHRGYRNNAALAALNTRLLQAALEWELHGDFKFTIVNAYDIIRPRLLFRPDNEVTCVNHYICTVSEDRGDEHVFVYSPGGKAAADAVVHAVFGAWATTR